jgi:histidinol-phosphate aminotransferase
MKVNRNILLTRRLDDKGEDRSGFVRMDKNEKINPFSKNIYKKIFKKIDGHNLLMYPDQRPFYKKLSKFLKIKKENTLLTSGSDSAIKFIFETYTKKNDKVAYFWPTYGMIDFYCTLYGCKSKKINYDKNLNLNLNQLIKICSDKIKVLFIVNPNQPTGTILNSAILKKIINLSKKYKFLLVFDEAYIEFSSKKSLVHLTEKYKNIVITRTFSKAFGLAGARIGYLVSHRKNVANLMKVKPYADINILAIKSAEVALDNLEILKKNVLETKKSKKIIKKFCKKRNLQFIDTETNFVHIKFKNFIECKKIFLFLKSKKFLARINGSGLPATIRNCLRFSLGPVNKTIKLISLLDKKANKL